MARFKRLTPCSHPINAMMMTRALTPQTLIDGDARQGIKVVPSADREGFPVGRHGGRIGNSAQVQCRR